MRARRTPFRHDLQKECMTKTAFQAAGLAVVLRAGAGLPQDFPALKDNDTLAGHALVVSRVRTRKAAMPAFLELTAQYIAAVATQLREARRNTYGAVCVDEVEAVLASVEVEDTELTVRDGVCSSRQANGVRLISPGDCAPCQGTRMNGAPAEAEMDPGPPLAGPTFLRDWDGRTLAARCQYARSTMSVRNPGPFSDAQSADIIACMLSFSDLPPATRPCPRISTRCPGSSSRARIRAPANAGPSERPTRHGGPHALRVTPPRAARMAARPAPA